MLTGAAAYVPLAEFRDGTTTARCFRVPNGAEGNPHNGGTLEWLPQGNYAARSVPRVNSREPL